MSPDIARSSAPPPAAAPAAVPTAVPTYSPAAWWRNWRVLSCVVAGVAYPFLLYWVPGQRQSWLGILLFLPPVCINLGLAWLFGHTLLPGGEPLITRFARMEPALPDAQVRAYTRRLTWVWTAFFLLMATVSGTLVALAAHEAWVWFTAVGNYLCVAALFALEYGYRRWRFPRREHVSPLRQLAMLRAAMRTRDR